MSQIDVFPERIDIPGGAPKWFRVKKKCFEAHFGAPRAVLVANFQAKNGASFASLCDAVKTVYSSLHGDASFEVDMTTGPGPTFVVFLPGLQSPMEIAPFVKKGLEIIDRNLSATN